MLFKKGYPDYWFIAVMTILSSLVVVFVWHSRGISTIQYFALLLSLEGIVLLAASINPVGGLPAQGNLIDRIFWFFRQEYSQPIVFNKPLFWSGVTGVWCGRILSAL